ncbi:MAG: transcription termination/antitermination factor NusG [Elusimicrobia bacterium]|nr:transcription termination/antitermination factor NusG [Elusimicrobiota bacterium]
MPRAWYIVHTQSGFEDRVRTTVEKAIEKQGLQKKIFQVLVPTEEVVELRRGKRVVRKRKFFPGYILLDMLVDNDTYWLVRGTTGVTGFLGGVQPVPLPEEEVKNITDLTVASAQAKPKPAILFEKGESVRIADGPFRHFVGVVDDVNEPKAKLKAMVTIFGRPTPVELDFLQVEKV